MATKKNRLAAAVTAAVAVLAGVCASFANAAPRAGTTSFVSPPPKLERQFNWYHSNPAGRKLQARETQRVDLSTFGSKAIVGLETNRDLQALIEDYGFSFLQVEAVPQLHAAEVTGDPAQLETLLSAAPNDARIRYVSPVGPKRHLLHRRNDPYTYLIDPATNAPYEWQVAATHLDKAFNLSHGRPDILLCSVDSGVADIPDLKGKVVDRLYDPTSEHDGFDVVGHGTATASIMVSTRDDGFGIVGFGGDSRLISYRVDDLWDNAVAVGINRLTSLGCRIINLSFGGPQATSPILLDSIRKALYAGVLIVAAAGNDGTDGLLYPAADVQPANGAGSLGLAVGASNLHGNVAEFSNTGDNLSLSRRATTTTRRATACLPPSRRCRRTGPAHAGRSSTARAARTTRTSAAPRLRRPRSRESRRSSGQYARISATGRSPRSSSSPLTATRRTGTRPAATACSTRRPRSSRRPDAPAPTRSR